MTVRESVIARHRQLPARRIIAAISDAAARWRNADFAPRVRVTQALIERTGYREPVIDFALDRLFESLEPQSLERVIAGELGSVDALDRFVNRTGRAALHARGVERVAILSSRTTVGVALTAAVFAAIAKATVLVKDRSDGLIHEFFRSVIAEEPDLRDALVAQAWDGADPGRMSDMDVVVAFGGNTALGEIRARLHPQTRFVGFGPRMSCGILKLNAMSNRARFTRLRNGAARDIVLYEAEGCMSLHLLFAVLEPSAGETETQISLKQLSDDFAAAIDQALIEFPAAIGHQDEALRLASARSSLRFRAAVNEDICSESEQSCVLVMNDEPPPLLPRTLLVIPIRDASEIRPYLHRHHLKVEAVSIDHHDPTLVPFALETGAVRIAAFGNLQQPPLTSEHGGRTRISDFVDFVANEM